jgi:probable O-glycosylation ligase (exosortase A-associated)
MLRDLFVFAVVMALLPTSIRRPFIGLLLFSWLAYMRPQDLCWGFARTMRFSFFVAIAMVVGWWAHEQGRRRFATWDVRTLLMCLLGLFVSASYANAHHHSQYTHTYFVEFLKILVIALFTTAQIDSRDRFRWMVWTIALSLGFFGVKNGLIGILRGGQTILRGPGGMLEDNNDFALALTMNVPLLWYLGIEEAKRRPWVLRASQVAVGLTIVTILLTLSRGGFLALCMTLLWMAWRSGQLFRAVMVLFTLAALFPLLAPEALLERLGTIGDSKESSANARLVAWATAMRMIGDNPLLGVGLRNFQPRYSDYSGLPPGVGQTYVAHNSYLQIWAESGTLAFVVYLTLLGSVFVACNRIWRMAKARPDLAWAGNYARMMEATMVGFLVGAFFLSRGQFDLIYHWLALVTSLSAIVSAAWVAAPAGAVAVAAEGARGIAVTWGRRAVSGSRTAARAGDVAVKWGRRVLFGGAGRSASPASPGWR